MGPKECRHFDETPGPVPREYPTEIYTDDRGHFSEAWSQSKSPEFSEITQINHSYSEHSVIRGMHWQVPPFDLVKYVTCLRGCIEDMVVDLRKGSSTFGHWKSYYLMGSSALKTRHSLLVPSGFAHGFLVTSESADVMYLQDGPYCPEAERSFRFDDPDIGINWFIGRAKGQKFILSEKDLNAPAFKELNDADFFI